MMLRQFTPSVYIEKRSGKFRAWHRFVLCPVIFAALIFSAAVGRGQEGLFGSVAQSVPENIVSVDTAWSADFARPGDRLQLAVLMDIADGHHINADAGQQKPLEGFKPVATRVDVIETSSDLSVEQSIFPSAHAVQFAFAEQPVMVFDGRVILRIPVTVSRNAGSGTTAGLTLQVTFQACDDRTCLFPEKRRIETGIPIKDPGEPPLQTHSDLFPKEDKAPVRDADVKFQLFGWAYSLAVNSAVGWVLFILTAAFGGFLLNFTPCVLPLIPIKVISLSAAADSNRKRCLLLGVSTFFGILFFWLAIGVLVATVSGFTAINQLFQFPWFTLSVGLVIAAMALGMMGLFHIRLPGVAYAVNPDGDSLPGAFVLGIMTAVLSTPCTAPFMGAAAAWATTQTPAWTLFTFSAIGCGMAIPYLMLSAKPGLAKKLPKTGPGSVLLKEVMGLFMMAAATYFIGSGISIWLVEKGQPPDNTYWWFVAAMGAAAGAWLCFRIFKATSQKGYRLVFLAAGLLIVIISIQAGRQFTAREPVAWAAYRPAVFETALAKGNTVVMVFTAEWCLNCKALEQSVLHEPGVVELLREKDVTPIKVDITGDNPQGKAMLHHAGSLTIPLLVVYSPSGEKVFSSDFYTEKQLIRAVNTARERRQATP